MILDISFDGLGDNLAYSTLPERCAEKGEKFYLHSSVQHLLKTNPEVFELIWKSNPYFKGFSNKMYDSGGRFHKTDSNSDKSVVWQLERLNGFSPKNKYPKIYCNLQKIKELENATIIDLNSFHYYKALIAKKNNSLVVNPAAF